MMAPSEARGAKMISDKIIETYVAVIIAAASPGLALEGGCVPGARSVDDVIDGSLLHLPLPGLLVVAG